MKKTLIALALGLGLTAAAQATVITFDSAPNQYWINSYSEAGFTMSLGPAEGLGTIQESVGYWNGNGTGRMLTWSNQSSVSGFSLTSSTNQLFSLNGFDFGNGYVAGNNDFDSITVTGINNLGNSLVAQIAHPGLGILSHQFSNWTNLVSATFVAHGSNNRAIFDNIEVNGVAAIPEPETYAMLLAGLGLMAGVARRRKQAAGK